MIKKFKIFLGYFLLCFSLFYYPAVLATEPTPNLDFFKLRLLNYYDSGQYNKDMTAVAQQAMNYLDRRVQQNNASATPKKLAIVLDIDETSLSNFKFLRDSDFGFPLQVMSAKQGLAQDPVLPATLALYQDALREHVAVFFITGRREAIRAATIENLHKAGYSTWTGLILKPNDFHADSAVGFKLPQRKNIEANGYDIVVNMGDQRSDLIGGYADRAFKLPNPYYYIP